MFLIVMRTPTLGFQKTGGELGSFCRLDYFKVVGETCVKLPKMPELLQEC